MPPSEDLKSIVLITGANTGLGFEITKALFARKESYHILIGCRGERSRASDAINELKLLSPNTTSTAEPLSIDVSSDESIVAAFEEVEQIFGHVDILVNNAGADFDVAMETGRISKRQGWNQSWDVNVSGTHILTETFAPLLLKSKHSAPRILFITSGLSSITELASGASPRYAIPPAGWPKSADQFMFLAYRSSKIGLNMVASEWARLLHNDGIKVFIVSPGFLNTGLGSDRGSDAARDLGSLGAIDPAIGGQYCADVIEGKRDDLVWPPKVLRKDAVQPW